MNNDFRKGFIPNLQNNTTLPKQFGVRKIEEVKKEVWHANHTINQDRPRILTREEELKIRQDRINSLQHIDNMNRK